jgi:predicted nuclease with TOPRIM domain
MPEERRLDMNQTSNDPIRQRVAELEAENARLRQALDRVKAERKELRDKVYGPFPDEERTTEEEMAEIMRNRVPGDGMKFFAELGLLPPKAS